MISGLIGADAGPFTSMMEAALAEARPDTHTVILSSEGLFHRWWDFSASGRAALQSLAGAHDLAFWVFFREPVSFARSLYIQMLKNPREFGPLYGRDVTMREMLDEPRFALHLDYIGYVRAVEALLGAGTVRPLPYRGDTVAAALMALEVGDMEPGVTQENRTIGQFGVDLTRAINQRDLPAERKWQAVRAIEELDRLVDGHARPLEIAPDLVSRIEALAAPSLEALEAGYGLAIGRPGEGPP
jgi:hypothetical protein